MRRIEMNEARIEAKKKRDELIKKKALEEEKLAKKNRR